MRYEIIPDFLTPDECNALITMAKSRLEPSTTRHPDTGEQQLTEHRVSNQMYFQLLENPLVASVERRIAEVTNTPIENGEWMQIVYYEPGGYFVTHFDDFNYEYEDNSNNPLSEGGHRIITFMMYLNDVDIGGDTYFHTIDLSVQPKTGKAFWWHNLLENGERDEDTHHEGRQSPTDKWILTKWIREDVAV